MKKFLLMLFISSFSFLFNAQAQIKKGAVLLGGDLGASTLKTTANDSLVLSQKNFNVSFSYGKAIRENLIFGVNVSWRYGWEKEPDNSNRVSKLNGWGLGAFLRKYKQLGASGFSIFAQGSVNGEYVPQRTSYNSGPPNKFNNWYAAVAAYPGLSFSASKKLQIETGFSRFLQLSYGRSKNSFQGVEGHKSSSFSFSSSIDNLSSLYLGFRVLLN